jgi:hypothetical protein
MATTQTDRSNSTPTSNQNDRASGLSTATAYKGPCIACSTSALTLSGEQSVNGVVLVEGDRVLLAITGGHVDNGIYVVSTGLWTRAADFNNTRDLAEGTTVRVTRGTNAGVWMIITEGDIIPGTTAIELERDSSLTGAALLSSNNLSDVANNILSLDALTGTSATIAISGGNVLDLSDEDVATGFHSTVSGNATINSVLMRSQQIALVRFSGTPTITAGANLVLAGENGGNITVEAGDWALLRCSSNGLTVYLVHLPLNRGRFLDTNFIVKDNSDPTKAVQLQASGITAGQTRTLTVPDASGTIALIGSQDEWLPAGAFIPAITNGPSAGVVALATSGIPLATLDFDATTFESACCFWRPPKRWDGGTITFEAIWTAASGSGGVVFQLAGRAFSNDDALDAAAFSANVTAADTLITANDNHTTPTSGALTLDGSPVDADLVVLRIARDPTNGSDTLAVDAKLLGVVVHYTANAGNDA